MSSTNEQPHSLERQLGLTLGLLLAVVLAALLGLSSWLARETALQFEEGPQTQKLLVWQGNFQKNGEELLLVIAEDVAPLLVAIRGYLWTGVIAALSAVLLVLALQRAILRRAFARLDRTRREVRQVREGRLQRLSIEVPAEVRPLVEEFNQLLDAWREHQARSRNALGNLAHAIKTPLQLILRQAAANGDDQLQEMADRIQQRLEQELRRARIIGPAGAGQHFRPHDDLQDLIATIQTLHRDRDLQIDLNIDAPDALPLEQADLLELLGNLLDNAAKWAQHRIRLDFWLERNTLHISLEDDGPGIPPEERTQILARGHRLDENMPGHGLGLTIASEIVTCYHGRLELDQSSELGGLRVSITLPLP